MTIAAGRTTDPWRLLWIKPQSEFPTYQGEWRDAER
jgi:hypothetical protein